MSHGHRDVRYFHLSMDAGGEPNQTVQGLLRGGLWIKEVPSYYTPSQVALWLDCIGFEPAYSEKDVSTGLFPITLENLHTVVRLHLIAFPFENTAMHYSADHSMDVTPEGAFRRLVLERQGYYCCGQNGVLLGMLRGLGYRAYGAGARVNSAMFTGREPDYGTISHLVILVQPLVGSNKTYVVDVGFGGACPTQPILLSHDVEALGAAPPEKHRLTQGRHPASSLESRDDKPDSPHFFHQMELWLEPGDPRGSGWSVLYSFSEDEFFMGDILGANFGISMRPGFGIFWGNVLCVKHFVLTEAEAQSLQSESDRTVTDNPAMDGIVDKSTWLGRLVMFGGQVKRNVGNRSELVTAIGNEVERIHVLRDLFGINIDDDDAGHIEGRDAAFHVPLK